MTTWQTGAGPVKDINLLPWSDQVRFGPQEKEKQIQLHLFQGKNRTIYPEKGNEKEGQEICPSRSRLYMMEG